MASTTSTKKKKKPPRLSTKDYMIRSKALDLLQRASNVDHQIVYENDSDEDSDFSWITPISYQHCPGVPAMERECQPARIAVQDQWIDVFLPAVSCISNACKEGVISMVKQTSDGFQEIQNDLRERRQHRTNVKEILPPNRPPRYPKRDPFEWQRGGYSGTQTRRTAGQQTEERFTAATADHFGEEGILCYRPGDWRPSGVLFVPDEELRQYQYDDVSAMTDDGSGGTKSKKCLGFCPVL